MSLSHPYQPPKSDLEPNQDAEQQRSEEQRIFDQRVAGGQKRILVSFLCMIFIMALNLAYEALPPAALLAIPFYIVAYFAAIFGVLKAMSGLRYANWVRVVILLFCHIPLLSLLAMLWISGRCTQYLKRHGYRVGFFGASIR